MKTSSCFKNVLGIVCLLMSILLLAVPAAVHAQQPDKVLSICPGDTVLLSIDSLEQPGIKHYDWFKNGELIASGTHASLSVADTGVYNVVAYNDDGCGSPFSNDVSVRWKELRALNDEKYTDPETPTSVSILLNDTAGCVDIDSSSVVILHRPGHGDVKTTIFGRLVYSPNMGFAGVDSFDYVVKDMNGNRSNVATVVIHVGANPTTDGGAVVIYPNPVSDFLYIKGDPDEIAKIMLVTDRGRRIYEMTPYNDISVINMSQYSAAVYIVRILYKSGKWNSYKILKPK